MSGKPISLAGNFETKHIKLGAGRIYLGTSAATFAGTSKFDTTTLDATWEDLGVLANNFTITPAANILNYRNALPSMTRKTFVIGLDATVTATFDEFKARVLQTALGRNAPFNKTSGTEMVVAASPTPTSTVFTLDAVTGLSVGDEVVVGTTAELPSTANSGLISAINTLAVTLRQALPLGAPATGAKVIKRVSTELIFGGNDTREYPLLFVVDFVNDHKQFVAFFPRVASAGQFSPNFGGGTNIASVDLTWNALAVYNSEIAELSLFNMFMFESENVV